MSESAKEFAGKLFDAVHESCGLVSCDTGADIGWAPEEAIPTMAELIAARDAELIKDSVRAAVLECAKTICCFCVEGIPYDEIGHHEGERQCYAHLMLAANRASGADPLARIGEEAKREMRERCAEVCDMHRCIAAATLTREDSLLNAASAIRALPLDAPSSSQPKEAPGHEK